MYSCVMKSAALDPRVDIDPLDRKTIIAFLSLVDRSAGDLECWIWLGEKNAAGYGMFGKTSAHKLSYQIHHRVRLPFWREDTKRHMLHLCDNRGCCNPDHLYFGTAMDNALDKKNKAIFTLFGGTATANVIG